MRSLAERWSLHSKHEDDQVKPPVEITKEHVPELTFGAYDFDGAHPEYKPLGEFSQDRRFIDERRGIIAVFDGVGSGVASGKMADVAIEALKHSILMELAMDEPISDSDMHGYILSALQDMQDAILREMEERKDEILELAEEHITRLYPHATGNAFEQLVADTIRASTTTIALAKTFIAHDGKTCVVAAGIGDSRVYLQRHDHLFRLTEDDTLISSLVQAGVMSPREDEQPEYISISQVTEAIIQLNNEEAALNASIRLGADDAAPSREKIDRYRTVRALQRHLHDVLRHFHGHNEVSLADLEPMVLRCLGDRSLLTRDTRIVIEELREGDCVFALTDGAYKPLDTPHPKNDRTWLELATRMPDGDTIQDVAKYVASFARAAPHSTDDITVAAMRVTFPKKDKDVSAHERETWMPE